MMIPVLARKSCVHSFTWHPTVTRFIDSLVHKGYLIRQADGKAVKVYPTKEGEDLRGSIAEAWKNLHQRYSNVLSLKNGDELAALIDIASEKLGDQL